MPNRLNRQTESFQAVPPHLTTQTRSRSIQRLTYHSLPLYPRVRSPQPPSRRQRHVGSPVPDCLSEVESQLSEDLPGVQQTRPLETLLLLGRLGRRRGTLRPLRGLHRVLRLSPPPAITPPPFARPDTNSLPCACPDYVRRNMIAVGA